MRDDFTRRSRDDSVESDPSGASVTLECEKVSRTAVTPARMVIPRNSADCVVSVSKEGFGTKSVPLDRAPSRQYWTNFAPLAALPFGIADNSPLSLSEDTGLALLFTGILGLGIDAFDGAMFHHEPSEVRVVLERN